MVRSSPRLRRALQGKAPSLRHEREWWARGDSVVIGLDEVGRGAWAGPLTIAAAMVPRDRRITGVRDSKVLLEEEREALYGRLVDWVEGWAVGHASHEECDRLGMSAAQRLAARRAIDGLGLVPDRVLVDGPWDFVGTGNVETIVKGDATSLSIAAASVLAKVTRDRIMREEAESFPAYDFDTNKGYPCPRHRTALRGFGPSSIHRRSWAFMDDLVWKGAGRIPSRRPAAHPDQESLFG